MLNLIHTDSGEVSYFGLPLSAHETEIKQRIGYSAGTVSWYPRKTIREIVSVVKSFYRSWDEDAYRSYRTLFGIDENKKPIELSDGMKVKFNLLLALSHRAEVLILDEPTSGLDPFSRDELLQVFQTLKEHGVTILFSTHITSDLERCADNIIYISRGGPAPHSGIGRAQRLRLRPYRSADIAADRRSAALSCADLFFV